MIEVYGDDKLLHTSPPISRGLGAVDFNIDITSCSTMVIKIYVPNLVEGMHSMFDSYSKIAIVDATLAN